MRPMNSHRAAIATVIASITLSLAAPAFAGGDAQGNRLKRLKRPTAVPELSVAAAGAAIVLLGGGLLVANGRRRKKP